MAIRRTLRLLVSEPLSDQLGMLDLSPDELLVGRMPPYSVGQGKEFVGHLTHEESLRYWLEYVNDRSAFGHVVPNHARVFELGIEGILKRCEEARSRAGRRSEAFYSSVAEALQGVLEFADAYAERAERLAQVADDESRRAHFTSLASRLRHTPRNPPRTFLEAAQGLFLVHCALHGSGETVSVGRLDQLLGPYYDRDIAQKTMTRREAQEIIDCLWIKFDERVILDRRYLQDRFTFADGALLGSRAASNFDQGCLLNQWMQQVTIGGVKANDSPTPEDGVNEVTFLCLEAARRLPLNSPTLDLRLHARIDERHRERLFRSAAATLLSGGAHPVLMNDDKIVPALASGAGIAVPLSSARNYACDGCYETLFAGETEFSFGYVPALSVLEWTLNRGAGIAAAGPAHLRGFKESFRTPPATSIDSFEQFWEIFLQHLEAGCHRFLHGVLSRYGSKEQVCPSPLLSALLAGCLESGRDLTGGGTRYHLFSPLMTGISTCADSLYVIQHLVFPSQGRPRTLTLEELTDCLRSDWGEREDVPGVHMSQDEMRALRKICSDQPKFGAGVGAVDQFAWRLIDAFCDAIERVREHPIHAEAFRRLDERFSTSDQKFELLLAPGVGTFEQYAFGGSFVGATPDGRRAGEPIASDLSPSPLFDDEEPIDAATGRHRRQIELRRAMTSFENPAINRLGDGAPPDFNVAPDFPADQLAEAIRSFAYGQGSNMMTVTVTDPAVMAKAVKNPDDYDLLRVRMGGWTEFFVTLFPRHQRQHLRRPLLVPESDSQ